MSQNDSEKRAGVRLAVQYADRDCSVWHGLSLAELAAALGICLSLAVPLALLAAVLFGFWVAPLLLFAATALGVRLAAAVADRLRDGKPHGWLERQLAWSLRRWLLPTDLPQSSHRWIPWRLRS